MELAKKGDICEVEGCNNLVMSHGHGYYYRECTKHHKQRYNMPYLNKKHRRQIVVLDVSRLACSKCGWDKSYCDRHRIISGKDGGKYTKENIIPLCPNCHRMEHMKYVHKIQTPSNYN